MNDRTPLLQAQGISVVLDGRPVLTDVAMAAGRGEFVAVIGPNGAGKTTLMRAAAGLLAAEGTVAIDGRSLAQMPIRERAARIGYLPQGHVFHWPLPVAEVVGLGRLPRSAGADLSEDDRLAVERALEATGMTTFAERRVTTLSGGERARVALARVLATEAQLILADEPTASLDPRYQLVVLDILKKHAATGAVVAVLHDLGLAARYADRLILLAGGRVVAVGSPTEVLTEPLIDEAFGIRADVFDHRGATVVIPRAVL